MSNEMQRSAITYSGRAASMDVRGNQPGLFPFDAFEFEDPQTNATPRLSMKSPWIFEASTVEVGGITLGTLSDQLQSEIEKANLTAEDNRAKLQALDGSVLLQGNKIGILGNEVTLQGESITLQAGEISEIGDDLSFKPDSVNEDGDPITGSSITLGLDEEGGYTEFIGTLRSSNFDRDVDFKDREGWMVQESGDAEFNSVRIRGFQMPSVGSSYTIYVKTTPSLYGEFATITEALEFLSCGFINFVNGGVQAIITVEDGYEITENIEISNIDLGWVTINGGTSSNPILVDSSLSGYLISVDKGARSPEINMYIRGNSSINAFYAGGDSSLNFGILYLYDFNLGCVLEDGSSCTSYNFYTRDLAGTSLLMKSGSSFLNTNYCDVRGLSVNTGIVLQGGSSAHIETCVIVAYSVGLNISGGATMVIQEIYESSVGSGDQDNYVPGGNLRIGNVAQLTNMGGTYNFKVVAQGDLRITTLGVVPTCNLTANSITTNGLYIQ